MNQIQKKTTLQAYGGKMSGLLLLILAQFSFACAGNQSMDRHANGESDDDDSATAPAVTSGSYLTNAQDLKFSRIPTGYRIEAPKGTVQGRFRGELPIIASLLHGADARKLSDPKSRISRVSVAPRASVAGKVLADGSFILEIPSSESGLLAIQLGSLLTELLFAAPPIAAVKNPDSDLPAALLTLDEIGAAQVAAVAASLTDLNLVVGLGTIASGRGFSCRIIDGNVFCNGRNQNDGLPFAAAGGTSNFKARLGHSLEESRLFASSSVPLLVQCTGPSCLPDNPFTNAGLHSVGAIQVVAGNNHACALLADGRAACWGANTAHEASERSVSFVPPTLIDVSNLKPGEIYKQLSTGVDHSCGLTTAGRILCWGNNMMGQAENVRLDRSCDAIGTNCSQFAKPHLIPDSAITGSTNETYVYLASGKNFNCAITARGPTYCWGGSNESHQWGFEPNINDRSNNTVTPTPVQGWINDQNQSAGTVLLERLSLGSDHACGITASGVAVCWGKNDQLQLGQGSATANELARPVLLPDNVRSRVRSIFAGSSMSCAVVDSSTSTEMGNIYCWGTLANGATGQLRPGLAAGSGSSLTATAPVKITLPETPALPELIPSLYLEVTGPIDLGSNGGVMLAKTTDSRYIAWGSDIPEFLGILSLAPSDPANPMLAQPDPGRPHLMLPPQ